MAYNTGRKSCTFVCQEKNLQKSAEKSSCQAKSHKPSPPAYQKSNGRPLSATFLEVKVKACFFGDYYFTCKKM